MKEMFAEVENEPRETGPSNLTMAQSGVETTANIEQESEAALPDAIILAALRDDTQKMERGETDEETFGDDTTASATPVTELEEEVVEDRMPSSARPETIKSAMDMLIKKSSNTLRASGQKKGAWRIQPVDSNDPPSPDAVLRMLKTAKLSVVKIIKPGQAGASSTKFNTYVISKPSIAQKIKFVYGQGRNEGQKFEEVALKSMSNAVKGKFDNFSKQVFQGLGLSPAMVAGVNIASAKRVKRPLSTTLENVGPMISDMDILLKNGNRMYVSLKNEDGLTFANSGYKGAFISQMVGTKAVIRPQPHKLDEFIVEALGIDKNLVAKGITDYANRVPTKKPLINVPVSFNAVKIQQFLAAAYGYGYWYVRKRGGDKVDVLDLTTAKKTLEKLGAVTSVVATYPFWSKERATKQLSVKITTTTGNYLVEVRNTQSSVEPNEIKVKLRGATKVKS